MPYRDVHLHLTPSPEETPRSVVDFACGLASLFDARLNATSCRLTAGGPSDRIGGGLVAAMARQAEEAAADVSDALVAHLEQKALENSLDVRLGKVHAGWPGTWPDYSWRGRLSDVCVLGAPVGPLSRRVVEQWLFGAGRPCVLAPGDRDGAVRLGAILICWDGSRNAARAVFDAMPLLHRASHVTVAAFRESSHARAGLPARALSGLLAERGVASHAEDLNSGDAGIGPAILDHASRVGADLLVMGAYGHGRAHEFILGGATRHVLGHARLPVLMSH